MIVPPAGIHEGDFEPDVGFVELGYLLQRLAHAIARIIRAMFRLETRRIGFAQHVNGFERFGAGAAQRLIHRLRIKRLEAALHRRRLRKDAELAHVRQGNGRRGTAERQRQIWSHGHGAERRSARFGVNLQRAIEPAIVGRFHAGCAGLHIVLRVEMGPRRIGRTGGMDNGELLLAKKGHERREARMQPEEAVEVERC